MENQQIIFRGSEYGKALTKRYTDDNGVVDYDMVEKHRNMIKKKTRDVRYLKVKRDKIYLPCMREAHRRWYAKKKRYIKQS